MCLAGSIDSRAQAAAPIRVTQAVDETKLTTLHGHVIPAANAANDRGPVDSSEHAGHIMLLLSRTARQQQDLDAFVDQLHNRRSANYHKWLTPAEFGRRFQPADEDVAAVKAWLESKGLTVEEIPTSKTHITFTGTVGQVQDALHIRIHRLSVNGEAHESTIDEPRVPAALAPVIAGFHKLNDFQPKPQYKKVGTFTRNPKTGISTPVKGTVTHPSFHDFDDSSGGYDVGPQDFYTIYNENPLLTAGVTGAGETIAVIEDTQVNPADVISFRAQFGLPTYPATPNSTQGGVNYIFGASGGVGGDAACTAPLTVAQGNSTGEEGEADIDLQWAGTVAPNAIVDFVACGPDLNLGNFGSSGVDYAAQHIVNYLSSTVSAASLSYGWCESVLGASNTTGTGYYNNQWEQFAAEGITAIVSSGDSGTSACDNGDSYITVNPTVNGMGSSAYNVSAGGTDLADAYITNSYATSPATTWWGANTTNNGSALSYIPEIAWGGMCSNSLYASYLVAGGDTEFGSTPEEICNGLLGEVGYLTAEGGSGGISTVSAAPTWQSVYGVGLYSGSTTQRTLPDVSLFAAAGFWGHSLPFCESDQNACTSDPNTDGLAGGTSFVAPQLAGLMALVNQKTGMRQGQADYTFYGLAAQEYGTPATPNSTNLTNCSGSAQGANIGTSCIFQDIAADTPSLQGGTIASNNVEPCLIGNITDCYVSDSSDSFGLSTITTSPGSSTLSYYVGAGYDMVTGLGSVNITNLVNNWTTVSPGFLSTTALNTSSATIAPTGSVTLTATVTATGRGGAVAPAGVVQFYLGSTSGTLLGSGNISPSCTGSGASTVCTGVATLAVAGSALSPASNSIVARFEGDGANDSPSTSSSVSVWVIVSTTTAVGSAPNPSTLGQSVTFTATITPTLGAVAPTGTVTWSTNTGCGTTALSAGAAICTTTALPLGSDSVTASYSGDSNFAASNGGTTQTVNPAQQPATLTTPTPSSKLSGSSVTFNWTPGTGVTAYWLYLGTTGAKSTNVYSSGSTKNTSATVNNVPTNGVILYATLYSLINGNWVPESYTYTESGSYTLASMSSPTPGTTLGGSSATFNWNPGAGPTAYWLYIGTTGPKSANLLNSGSTTATSLPVNNLPTNGVTIYVTLFSQINGAWQPVSYTYTEFGTYSLAQFTSPAPGGTLSGSSVTFNWSPGAGPTAYYLYLGTTGSNSFNVYNSGTLSGSSVTVHGIPTNGGQLFATLFSNIDGAWQPVHATFVESGTAVPAAMSSPSPGSTFSGSSATFNWTAGSGVTAYWLYLGTTGPKSSNIYSSGAITGTSATATGLPTNGVTIYATLFSEIDGVWQPTSYTYTESGSYTLAAMVTPTQGSTLPGTSTTFNWSASAGGTGYWLYLGSTGPKSANLYSSGDISGTLVTVNGLPTNGETIYATLYTQIDGAWQSVSYTYTAQ